MKYLYLFFSCVFCLSIMVSSLYSCADHEPTMPQQSGTSTNNTNSDTNIEENDTTQSTNVMNVKVGTHLFTATLADNATAEAFKMLLPLTINMSELNGNEKYYYLNADLPTSSYRPGTIHNGDIMLYGSDCIVLFYETFSTPYSYTRIGSVDNPDGLAEALGQGRVTVTFEL